MTKEKDHCLYPIYIIGLTASREIVYDRINKRVDKMIKEGLLEEINSLKEEYQHSKVLNSAIGYKEFYDYLFNDKQLEKVIEEIKLHSRHYAKRQYTFFNHQFQTNWYEVNFSNFQETINTIYQNIKKEAY